MYIQFHYVAELHVRLGHESREDSRVRIFFRIINEN